MTWSVVQSDCIEFLNGLPENSVDLVLGSPPYLGARLYLENGEDLDIARDTVEWVDWMLAVTTAAVRVSKGLVLWVASGIQEDKCYQPCCEGLMWEWYKRGGQLWRPPIWWKVDCDDGGTGIPGSGGKQWMRNDWEYVMAFKKEGWLPWADPLVFGHEPIIAEVGGAMSNRTADGRRINEAAQAQGRRPWNEPGSTRRDNGEYKKVKRGSAEDPWGTGGHNGLGGRKKDGAKNSRKPPKMDVTGGHNADGTLRENVSKPMPKVVNPGNFLAFASESVFTLAELIGILSSYEQKTNSTSDQVLRDLRQADSSGRLCEWFYGVCLQIRASEILQPSLLGRVDEENSYESAKMPGMREGDSEEDIRSGSRVHEEEILLPKVSGEIGVSSERTEARWPAASRPENSKENDCKGGLREMRPEGPVTDSSSGSKCYEQRPEESPGALPVVPSKRTQAPRLQDTRVYESIRGAGILQQALPAIQDTWRSINKSLQAWGIGSGLVVKSRVGGGHMGSKLCHLSEAPFPEKLAMFFVLSFCPPGGVVCDTFGGSFTTGAVAIRHGRNFIGCDLRASQVAIGKKRIANETPLSLLDG